MLLSHLVFIIDHTQSNMSRQFSFDFDIDQTYIINHVVVLSGFCHRLDSFRLITITQFCFRSRPHLYDQSHSRHIWISLELALKLINHNSSILWKHRAHLYNRSCRFPIWFSSQTVLGQIDHDNLVSFSAYNPPSRSIISLSCLVFISNRTYTIDQVDILFGFHHRPQLVRSVMAA